MKLTRKPERGVDDRAALDAFLDGQLTGTLAVVVEGIPSVVPVLYVRDGDRLLIHGSTGAGTLRAAAGGAPVAFSVHAIDGIRVSYNGFHSGANYRSAVVQGYCRRLEGAEHLAALDRIVDGLLPGRVAEVPPPTAKEAAQTMTLELPLVPGGWLFKVRGGEVAANPEAGGVWIGFVPLTLTAGEPEAAAQQDAGIHIPDSVRALRARFDG